MRIIRNCGRRQMNRRAKRRDAFRNHFVILLLFLAILMPALPAYAGTTASLSGKLTDPSGALLPDATVALTNLETGIRQNASLTNIRVGLVAMILYIAPFGPLPRVIRPSVRCSTAPLSRTMQSAGRRKTNRSNREPKTSVFGNLVANQLHKLLVWKTAS